MIRTTIKDNLIRVVIIDISGIYAQIHNEGYFEKQEIEEVFKRYSDTEHWRVWYWIGNK